MTRFASAREAKEFLVARIVDQAQREGVSLSEVERNMLYFSEAGWAPPDIMATSDRFDRECDRTEYERKISRLIRSARKRARREDKREFDAWSDAIRILDREDHYLLVMTERAGVVVRPRGDRLRLWATAIAIALGLVCFLYVADRLGITREASAMVLWIMVACAVGAYFLLRSFAGRDRAQEIFDRLFRLFDQTK
jgi:hypothetical protein